MKSTATDALRGALVAQFGASARGAINQELERRLAGRKRLQKEDLDAIEHGVLAAVREGRRDAGARQLATPAGGSLGARASSTGRLTGPPSARAPSAGQKAAMNKTWSAGFQTFSGFKMNHPMLAPKDHFALLAEFADDEHKRSVLEKARERRRVGEMCKVQLDKQMEIQHRRKDAEKAEDKEYLRQLQELAAKAEERAKAQDNADAVRKANAVEAQRKEVLAASENAAAKRRKEQQVAQKATDQMRLSLERDKRNDEQRQVQLKAKKAHEIKVMSESRDLSRSFQRQKVLDNVAYESRIDEQAKQLAEQATADRSRQYANAQAVVDHIYDTVGTRNKQLREKQERDFDDRIQRNFEDKESKNYQKYWDDFEAKSRTLGEVSRMNQTMTLDFSKRGLSEKEENRLLAERWRTEEEARVKKESEAKAKLKQKIMETSRTNFDTFQAKTTLRGTVGLHRDLLVAPEKIQREVAYNGDILKQMVVQGYQPDMSQTLSMQATHKMPLRPKAEMGKARRHRPE